MPVISVELGNGQISESQKKQVIERFTAHAVEITGISADKFTILIHELPPENIGVGGKTLKDIKVNL